MSMFIKINDYQKYLLDQEVDVFLESMNENMVDGAIGKAVNFVKRAMKLGEWQSIFKKIWTNFAKSGPKLLVPFIMALMSSCNLSMGDIEKELNSDTKYAAIISPKQILDEIAKNNKSDGTSSKAKRSDTLGYDKPMAQGEYPTSGGMDEFLKALAYKESRGIPTATNGKYVGLYQIGDLAFKDIGSDMTVAKFHQMDGKWSIEEQNETIKKVLAKNKQYLGKYYTDYLGKKIKGVTITKAGLLAASHLVGFSKVKEFLKTEGKSDAKDGNGVMLSNYLSLFSKFNVDV